ncbi:DPY30 domain containing 2 isoform X2 [Misgurnus anguillicaudatus]|uniref:DPY30 domain containing 2 isoform X2 n=1 Tax=Misgurnus anguillicaudatus TaxID=75329 RepID=UPI003CCFCA88
MDEDVRQVDAEYLRRNLGRCLAEGLTEIVERRPLDPIEFLVHWIHKYKLNNQLIQERSVYQRELEEQQRRVREESIHQKLLEDEQKQINDAHHQLKLTEESGPEPARERDNRDPPEAYEQDNQQIITEIAPEDLQSTNPPESDPVMKEVTQQSDPSQLIDSTAEDQINKDESDEEADQSTDVDQTHEIPNNPQGQSEADSVSSEVNPVQDDEAQAEKTDEADSEERQTEMQIESEHENHSDTVEEHDDAVRPEDSAQPDVLQSDRQVKG